MFKMKHLGVAAVIVLVAAGAMASNFRAADQVYVPAAGHTNAGNSTFISDVWVSNMSTTDSVDVSVIYTPLGATPTPQYFDKVIQIPPGQTKEYIDFFANPLSLTTAFGSLVFNACKQGADCVQNQDTNGVSPNFRPIVVFTRIYAVPLGQSATNNTGTNGQDMPGIPWYNFVSSRQATPYGLGEVRIQGLRNTGGPGTANTVRGNIGLMNASQFSTTTLVLDLYAGNNSTTPLQEARVTLGPLGFVQQNLGALFSNFAAGPTATNGYVTIHQENNIPTNDAPSSCLPDGCPGFLAYGSVLDNVTNDPTTLEAVYEKALSDIPQALDAIYPPGAGKAIVRRAVRRH